MGRWTEESNSGVPDGMQRIGYDSDTHRYTFRDGRGNVYVGDESGGELRLVSRPTGGDDNEPIRLFPDMPTDPNAKSLPSPTSFGDMLPPHLIASAPPMAPPRKGKLPSPTALAPSARGSGHGHACSDPGSKRSLWGIVRSTTLPVKMRGVVDNVMRRPTVKRDVRESDTPGASYARLGEEGPSVPRKSSSSSSHLRLPSRKSHQKGRTE